MPDPSPESLRTVFRVLTERPASGITAISRVGGLPIEEVRACLGVLLRDDLARYKSTRWSFGVYWWLTSQWGTKPNLNELWQYTRDKHPELKPPIRRQPGDPSGMISKAERKWARNREKVMKVLDSHKKPMRLSDIADLTELPISTVTRHLNSLQLEGVARYVVITDGGPGRPAKHWSLQIEEGIKPHKTHQHASRYVKTKLDPGEPEDGIPVVELDF